MFDRYKRHINYLRISVTDRCNLRCRYCMPEEGVRLLPHSAILSFDEITLFVREAVRYGVDKVRITGGEPLVRRGIVDLVGMIAGIEGISDISMTTNGTLLPGFAPGLAAAGLQRVNISLDTLDQDRYRLLTRGGSLDEAIAGIDSAIAARLTPVKINCVVRESSREPDAAAVTQFGISRGIEVRYIRQMDLARGEFGVVEGGDGGNCSICNRLRLTADGKLKPCLFDDLQYDIRELGAARAIEMAIDNKPACGSSNFTGEFYNLGG